MIQYNTHIHYSFSQYSIISFSNSVGIDDDLYIIPSCCGLLDPLSSLQLKFMLLSTSSLSVVIWFFNWAVLSPTLDLDFMLTSRWWMRTSASSLFEACFGILYSRESSFSKSVSIRRPRTPLFWIDEIGEFWFSWRPSAFSMYSLFCFRCFLFELKLIIWCWLFAFSFCSWAPEPEFDLKKCVSDWYDKSLLLSAFGPGIPSYRSPRLDVWAFPLAQQKHLKNCKIPLLLLLLDFGSICPWDMTPLRFRNILFFYLRGLLIINSLDSLLFVLITDDLEWLIFALFLSAGLAASRK